MAFSAQELENKANAAIDFHLNRGTVHSQAIQDKPLLNKLVSTKKTFPGGKEYISVKVKGVYTTSAGGYTHDDTVAYSNPANIKQALYQWKELHSGIAITYTELKHDGMSVNDEGKSTSNHSQRDMTALANLFEDKLEDMSEGTAQSLSAMFWKDGTQDAKEIAGIRSLILDVPAVGTTGTLNRATFPWWRNRASLAIDSSTPSNQNLVNTLQKEWRQLRRYGGRPDVFFAGSDFMDAYEKELRAKGNYTETGWANKGKMDASIGDLAFKNVEVIYEPELDDQGLAKYGYIWDSRHVFLDAMDGEWEKRHSPRRPAEKYVIYRALTYTGGLVARQLNSAGVYSIA